MRRSLMASRTFLVSWVEAMFGEEVAKDAEDVLEVEEEAGGGSEDLESKVEDEAAMVVLL